MLLPLLLVDAEDLRWSKLIIKTLDGCSIAARDRPRVPVSAVPLDRSRVSVSAVPVSTVPMPPKVCRLQSNLTRCNCSYLSRGMLCRVQSNLTRRHSLTLEPRTCSVCGVTICDQCSWMCDEGLDDPLTCCCTCRRMSAESRRGAREAMRNVNSVDDATCQRTIMEARALQDGNSNPAS